MMRISTYAKRLESVLKHRPHFESLSVKAMVTLTGADNVPMIDLSLDDTIVSLNVDEARDLANWIKKVAQ
jgi:hypothetical protein